MLVSVKSRVVLAAASILLTGTLSASNDNVTYLALGDSVAFGLNPTLLVPPFPPPSAFIGYPEIVQEAARPQTRQEVNAACPGETSLSFIKSGVEDYGCNSPGPQGQPSYKPFLHLHTDYPGMTQLEFAVSQLSTNKHIGLVTLGIGSNDVLLLQKHCQSDPSPTTCVSSQLPTVFANYAKNLNTILTAIRKQAGYSGRLVLVGYYSPTPDLIPVAIQLNLIAFITGLQYGATFADGFTAFQLAAVPFRGNVCKAGLLISLDANTCDIHPSPKGRDLLAAVILAVIGGRP